MANALPASCSRQFFALWSGLGIWSKVALASRWFLYRVLQRYQASRKSAPPCSPNGRMLGMSESTLRTCSGSPVMDVFSLHTSVGFA